MTMTRGWKNWQIALKISKLPKQISHQISGYTVLVMTPTPTPGGIWLIYEHEAQGGAKSRVVVNHIIR